MREKGKNMNLYTHTCAPIEKNGKEMDRTREGRVNSYFMNLKYSYLTLKLKEKKRKESH